MILAAVFALWLGVGIMVLALNDNENLGDAAGNGIFWPILFVKFLVKQFYRVCTTWE